MINFWSYIKNEEYSVGCTGQTVYVYDSSNMEIAKFKDIKYAYLPMFIPWSNKLIVKSTEGRIVVYSLEERKLLRKFRFSKVDGSQDDGCCFSKDGRYFYNIERHIDSTYTRLSIYDTKDFEVIKVILDHDESIVLEYIECDNITGRIYVIGFIRDKSGCMDYGFISEIVNDSLGHIKRISNEDHEFITGYKGLELSGFTKKAKEWSSLKYENYDLDHIENQIVHLADYLLVFN